MAELFAMDLVGAAGGNEVNLRALASTEPDFPVGSLAAEETCGAEELRRGEIMGLAGAIDQGQPDRDSGDRIPSLSG